MSMTRYAGNPYIGASRLFGLGLNVPATPLTEAHPAGLSSPNIDRASAFEREADRLEAVVADYRHRAKMLREALPIVCGFERGE